jgi:hypothetical protein
MGRRRISLMVLMMYVFYTLLVKTTCLYFLQKIWNWFGNNVAKINQPGESAPKKRGKKVFSARDVVKSTHKERILDLVSMKTDRPMGHKDWLKHYPSALTKVMQALTQDELAEAETLADQWNNARLPREVQRT